jgi:hypothetical protein
MSEPNIPISYRTWYQGIPPRPIKLQIPGWSGVHNQRSNGDKAQPWHCVPFVEASTYGLELCYSFDTEATVRIEGGNLVVDGDFTEENKRVPGISLPPFAAFAPGHFGMPSCLDIKVPEDYVMRIEPHPRFFTDETNTVPCPIPGHIATSWWTKFFFVVFKNPMPGQSIKFRKGEPYAQIFVMPRKCVWDIREMSIVEINGRHTFDEAMTDVAKHFVTKDWVDHKGKNFDDKYKVLNNIAVKGGTSAVVKFVDENRRKVAGKKKIQIKNRYVKKRRSDEGVQNPESEKQA